MQVGSQSQALHKSDLSSQSGKHCKAETGAKTKQYISVDECHCGSDLVAICKKYVFEVTLKNLLFICNPEKNGYWVTCRNIMLTPWSSFKGHNEFLAGN